MVSVHPAHIRRAIGLKQLFDLGMLPMSLESALLRAPSQRVTLPS